MLYLFSTGLSNGMYITDEQELDPMKEPGPIYRGLAFLWEIVKVVVISLAIIIPIRYYLVQPFFVNGASMEDNFHDGDYILIDEISYRFNDPARGDIVVFRYPNDQKQFFVKRVIGLPSEIVEIKNDTVAVFNVNYPEGLILSEPYLSPGQETQGNIKIELALNEYFVLGDNRLHSSDSRYWGPVDRSLITGRVFARAWPISGAKLFHDPVY